LLPFLNADVTTSSFWTSWRYDNVERRLYDFNGNLKGIFGKGDREGSVQGNVTFITGVGQYNFTGSENTGRSGWKDKELCVTLGHHYEFPNQLHCKNPQTMECNWHFINYYPSNCNNLQGVICQHKDVLKSKQFKTFHLYQIIQ